jgi:hypothetical protein
MLTMLARGFARCTRRGCGMPFVDHPMHEEDAMRFGTLWRLAVLASLALLVSGQLCMITTCVPRLHHVRAATHACCRATPAPSAPANSQHSTGTMPCDVVLHSASAPVLDASAESVGFALQATAPAVMLAPPAHVPAPFADTGSSPPPERFPPAPAGPRAPPQA